MKAAVCLVVVIILSAFIGSRWRFFIITSDSMVPTIQAGDIVVTAKKVQYVEGDIVTFKIEKRHVTHRLVSKNGLYIQTRGDANSHKDNFGTNFYEIEGKVIHIFHSLWLKKYLRLVF